MKHTLLSILSVVLLVLGSLAIPITSVQAQITGHHNVLLDPTGKPPNGFREPDPEEEGLEHADETYAYHVTHTIARPYFGPDGFLGRDSIFLFAVSLYNTIHIEPKDEETNEPLDGTGKCEGHPQEACYQDFTYKDAEEGLNYFNAKDHWDQFAHPCNIVGDETWVYVINPATATTQAFHEGLGSDQPAWHSMRRISPCDDMTYTLYSPSDPFLDHPDSDRLFVILDQSNGDDFVRWRIQSVSNRDNGVRTWDRTEAGWDVLAEVSSSLIGVVDLLNVVCVDAGPATFTSGVLDVVEKACLFNFLVNNGANRIGRLNVDIDFGQSYPYTNVEIMDRNGAMKPLTRSGDKWILSFTPGSVSLLSGHIVQSIDNGTLFTERRDSVSGTSFCGNSYTSAFRLYRWPNFVLTQSNVSGTPTLVTKSAAGNPPGSTFLPTTFDQHLARFTFGASGNLAFSGTKWDPHQGGLPWVCSQNSFFNMGILAEPYN